MTRPRDDEAIGLPLFPCLAIMLSAMGVVIVMLVMVARNASMDGEAPAVSAGVVSAGQLAELRRLTAQLTTLRSERELALRGARDELAFLEDDTRKQEAKLRELQAALRQHAQLAQADARQRQAAAEEARRALADIADAEATIQQLEQEISRQPPSYSIIPHEGPYQTRRRPIYLECREDGVVVQPEGIKFSMDDLAGGPEATNPLAAVLRATREYHLQNSGEKSDAYPLFLVRPEGVLSYAAARRSMKSWGSDFGYELIESDWKVAYPTAPDPALAQVQKETLDDARVRHEAMLALARRQSGRKKTYVVSPSGGIAIDGGAADAGGPAIPYEREDDPPSSSGGRRGGAAASVAGIGATTGGGSRGTGSAQGAAREGTVGGMPAGGAGVSRDVSQSGGQADRAAGANAASGARSAGSTGNTSTASIPSGAAQPLAVAEGPKLGEYIDPADQPRRRSTPSQEAEEWSGSPSHAAMARGKLGADSQRHESATVRDSQEPLRSMAKQLGDNWALRNAARGSIPITRPIRVRCYADRLELLAADEHDPPRVVPLAVNTRDSMSSFVDAVWEHAKGWGIAGKGMYWRPVLTFYVQDGGQERYEEVARLLEGSGFGVKKRLEGVQTARPGKSEQRR